MKKSLIILALLAGVTASAQFQFGQKENFVFSTYIDPGASIKEGGLDIGVDIEYRGPIYAKIGIESFAILPGGYVDFHGAVGPRFTVGHNENLSIYAGGRVGFVGRNGAVNPIGGFEGGVDYTFDSGFLLGVNGSYMYRGDMKAMQWPEIWRENFYVKIGYSWDW